MPITLCVAGKSQAAVDVLRGALDLAERVVCLPNIGDDGIDGWQPSFLKAAQGLGVEIVSLDWAMGQPDLVFMSVEYDRIVKPALFASARLYNVHFSLLPKYRGCNTAVWPILNGEEESGVTLHDIDAGIDTGPIIAQQAFDLEEMTARQLYGECLERAPELVLDWLPKLLSGDYTATPQDEAEASSYPRKALDYGLKEIDLGESVEEVRRRIRAFTFPEYQRPTYLGVPILGAVAVTSGVTPMSAVEVSAADGALWLVLEQAEPERIRAVG